MVKAFDIRHRVTHPKTVNSISISVQEMDTINTAGAWFSENFKKLVLLRKPDEQRG
jgi:hypothetical protein